MYVGIPTLLVATMVAGLFAQPAKHPAEHGEKLDAQASESVQTPEMVIKTWPAHVRVTALAMISKYGEPGFSSKDALVWYNNSPWQKTVVYRKARPRSGGTRDQACLEQTVGYEVPDDKVAALKLFDGRIKIDRTNGELSSRSASESLNFLALNLADDIVSYRRSVKGARDFYRHAVRLSQSGKHSMYLDGLLFEVHNGRRPDPEDVKFPERP